MAIVILAIAIDIMLLLAAAYLPNSSFSRVPPFLPEGHSSSINRNHRIIHDNNNNSSNNSNKSLSSGGTNSLFILLK
jgi:hypothetical protein